jgi:hypothetical protein
MRFDDLSVRSDQIGDAPRKCFERRISRAVRLPDFAMGVGDDREGEVVLLREGRVCFRGIEAAADDLGATILVFLV